MSGICSFHIHEPIDRWHHFWKHGLHRLPWRSLIDKLDTHEPRANQCKSLVYNNTRQARQSSFFKVMACQVISVQQQALPGDLLTGCWHSPMARGWGLCCPVLPKDWVVLLSAKARASNLLFLLVSHHEASQLLGLALAPLTVATLVPDIWGACALAAHKHLFSTYPNPAA